VKITGVKTGQLNIRQPYLVSIVSNDRVRSILVCAREYCLKVCKFRMIKLNCVVMGVKICDRVLTEVGGKYERVRSKPRRPHVPDINPMRPTRYDVSRLNAAPRCSASGIAEALLSGESVYAECTVPVVALPTADETETTNMGRTRAKA
jgi:hypothetical protein